MYLRNIMLVLSGRDVMKTTRSNFTGNVFKQHPIEISYLSCSPKKSYLITFREHRNENNAARCRIYRGDDCLSMRANFTKIK